MLRRRDGAEEHGLSFVEVVIALGIVTLVFMSLAYVMSSAMRASIQVRRTQQATAVATKVIESARNASYDDLVMRDSDLAGDSRVLAGNQFDPDGSGPLTAEPLVTSVAGGGVVPHVTTEAVGSASYTVSKYVTWVSTQSYKRYVVIVTWNARGRTVTQRTSTLIARVRRGLGVPNYILSPTSQSKTAAAGGQVVLAHTIQNFGIVDTYDLQVTVPPGRSWTIAFYNDTNRNGTYESGTDTLLVDTNSNTTVDTGSVASSATAYWLAVWTLASNEPGGSATLTMTARSGADATVSKTATDSLTISGAGLLLYLHNTSEAPTADTTAQTEMPMNPTAPTATTLFKYSTNYFTANPGRFIARSAATISHEESDPQLMANWVYQLPAATTFNGNVELNMFVAMQDLSCDRTPQITMHVRRKNSANANTGGSVELLGTGSASAAPVGPAPCSFRQLTISVPISATVAANRWIEIKLGADDASQDAVLFAYDTTTYATTARLPSVSS